MQFGIKMIITALNLVQGYLHDIYYTLPCSIKILKLFNHTFL